MFSLAVYQMKYQHYQFSVNIIIAPLECFPHIFILLDLFLLIPGRSHRSPPANSPLHPRPVHPPPMVQASPCPPEEREHGGHPRDPLHSLCPARTPRPGQLPGLSKRTPAWELCHRYAHPRDPHSRWLRLRRRRPMWTLAELHAQPAPHQAQWWEGPGGLWN